MHRVTQEFPRRVRIFGYGPLTLYGAIFHSLHLIVALPRRAPTTPTAKPLVWPVPLSLATTYGIASLSIPPVTEMFHFTGYCVPRAILFTRGRPGIAPARLPHSDIHGSKRIGRSP